MLRFLQILFLHQLILLTSLLAMTNSIAAQSEDIESVSQMLIAADLAAGKKVFRQCQVCHYADNKNAVKVGPNLWGLVNSKIGGRDNFSYSKAMATKVGEWDYVTLNQYLYNPGRWLPGNRMNFVGLPSVVDRANVIAYLRTLGDVESPLPQPATNSEPDFGGLPAGPGREAVYFTCRACHSQNQFMQQRMDRKSWSQTLDVMIAKNGMAAPQPWARVLMLNYLATHFSQKDWQGLPRGVGREEVYYVCQTCHSLALVKQQGLNKARWAETLEWMVDEGGMDALPENEYSLILDYLTRHFGSNGG